VGIHAVSRGLRRAVFLDRDGVLNRPVVREGRPYPPACLEELEILPGVPAALAALRRSGFSLIVVTNQPDVSRGTQQRSLVEAMHAALRRALPLDGFYVCYHDDADACQCRKPMPGLLLTAAGEHGISLPDSYMVGDRWRDVEAGRRAGCRNVWIDRGYSEPRPAAPPDFTGRSLAEAAAWILQDGRQEQPTQPVLP
jgi:D-glycero-D-manno-heptose 1,7-bisphosphate phosphatase